MQALTHSGGLQEGVLYPLIHEEIWEPCGGPAMSGKREGSRDQSSKGRQGPTAAWMQAELCVCMWSLAGV